MKQHLAETPLKRLTTARRLSAALGGEIPIRTLLHLAVEKKIPAYKVGGRWKFDIQEVIDHISKK